MTALWPEHPLFSATTTEAAAAGLDLFNDGLIALTAEETVLSVNSEARRLLGLSEDAVPSSLADLEVTADGWGDVLGAIRRNRRGDMALRGAGNRSILATLTRDAAARHIQWILLRDVEAFEFRRDRSFGGKDQGNVRFLSNEKTRPDFETQRQLCPEVNTLLSRGERAIRQGARILITGESGVGKSEIARFLHTTVADARDPFMIVNCASSSEEKFDALLFGQDDANGRHRPGLIEQADGGTLFLDEVCEIPLSTQAKLLGFLDDGRLPHMQAQAKRPTLVRIISATNRDLQRMVAAGGGTSSSARASIAAVRGSTSVSITRK